MATEYNAAASFRGVDSRHDEFSDFDIQLRQPLPTFSGEDIAMVTPSEEVNCTYDHYDAEHNYPSNTYTEQDVHRFRAYDDAGNHDRDMQYGGEDADYQEQQQDHEVYSDAGDDDLEPEEEMGEDEIDYDEDEDFRRDLAEQAEWNYLHEEIQCPTPLPLDDADLADPPGTDNVEQIVAQKRSQGYFQERWQVNKESATFLALLARDIKADVADDMRYYLPTPLRHLKAEEPLLQCDPDTEMRGVLERNEVHLAPTGMTPFELDASNDESLEWGATNLALPGRLKKDLAAEKWHVDNEAIAFLKSVKAPEGESLEDWVRRERERKIIRKASPALLPLSPPWSPTRYEPSIANMPLTSTPGDPTVQEAAALHAEIAARDEAEAEKAIDAGMKEVGDFLVDDSALSSTPLRKKGRRLQNLKITSPVLPEELHSSEPPSKKAKTVAFTNELHTIIPCLPRITDMTDPEVGAQEAAASIIQMFRPLAQPAFDSIAKEKLSEVDTTARVTVPPVPPIKAIEPWGLSSEQQNLLKEVCQEVSTKEKKWSGASKLEKSLPWVPFSSHLARIRPEGDFDDGSCARYLKELSLDDDLDIQRLTWKPEGLRVLEIDEDGESGLEAADWTSDDEEEDLIPTEAALAHVGHSQVNTLAPPVAVRTARVTTDTTRNKHVLTNADKQRVPPDSLPKFTPIEPAQSRSPANMFSEYISALRPPKVAPKPSPAKPNGPAVLSIGELLSQRKAKLEAAAKSISHVVDGELSKDSRPIPERSTFMKASASNETNAQERSPTNTNAMAHFSQFLTLQGQPNVPVVKELVNQKVNTSMTADFPNVVANTSATVGNPATSSRSMPPSMQVPTPLIEDREQQFSVIFSAAMMENRYMIRKLQEHLPGLEIVVREHAAEDREADLTVSAGTGLMTTNLQKLKQKPLPGQKAISGIREHVATAATRYERLIVLVSEGKQALGDEAPEISKLDDRDILVLRDFVGQYDLMHTEVQVKYVPGGDEELFRWVAAVISIYATGQGFTPQQEETFWERFLRKAGLNAFAAQVVLRQLKVPEADREGRRRSPGLAAFICADEEERVQRFGPLLGGEGMLRRASKALDGRWQSAVNVERRTSWSK